MAKKHDAASLLLRRRRARKSMLGFVEFTHPKWESSEHHKYICDALDQLERGEITRCLMNAPPRHGKTELCSRRFPAYYLGRHPDHQIIISSYSDDLAGDISRDIRNILLDPYYQELCEGGEKDGFSGPGSPSEREEFGREPLRRFPGAEASKETTAGFRWETTAGGVVIARGIGGGITGRGAHLLIIDDPLKDREEADSARMRERCWSWYHGTATDRLMPGGKILVMQTRWHEDDLAGRLIENEDEDDEDGDEDDRWVKVVLPAILDEGTENERSLFPAWFPLKKLHRKKKEKTRAGKMRDWNAQYMQTPTAEEGIFIKREWFEERYDNPPEILRIYMASDLAVTEKKKSRFADYTVHLCGGLGTDGRLYMLEGYRRRTGPKDWIESLLDMVKRRHPMKWSSEAGVIRRAVEGQISDACARSGIYFDMNWIPPLADKQARGSTFKGWASMGRIVWPKNASWAEEIIEICIGFPSVRFDDGFDAMSTLCMSLDGAAPPVAPSKKIKGNDAYQRVKAIKSDQWLTR